MPTKSKNNYTPYWRNPLTGDVMTIPGVIHEIVVSADTPTPEGMSLLRPMELTVQIKTPKHWRCRSRKRFVKLLMSTKKLSRNEAERVAQAARIMRVPYGEAWWTYSFWG